MKRVWLIPILALCAWPQSRTDSQKHGRGFGKEIGSGAGTGGKDVAVGTVKGTGKIGIGKAFKKIF